MPPSSDLKQDDNRLLMLLRIAPFERRKNGWRFGTKRIADNVVDRLIASGHAVREGEILKEVKNETLATHRPGDARHVSVVGLRLPDGDRLLAAELDGAVD